MNGVRATSRDRHTSAWISHFPQVIVGVLRAVDGDFLGPVLTKLTMIILVQAGSARSTTSAMVPRRFIRTHHPANQNGGDSPWYDFGVNGLSHTVPLIARNSGDPGRPNILRLPALG